MQKPPPATENITSILQLIVDSLGLCHRDCNHANPAALELLQRRTCNSFARAGGADEVIVYSPQLDAEIARHPLLPGTQSRQQRLDPAHHPAPHAGRQRLAVLRQRYEDLGPTAVRFLEGLLQTQRYHGDHARRVLGFLGTYSRTDVLAALERAVRYGAYAAASVERILATQSRPMGLLEKLAAQTRLEDPEGDDSPPIQPRSTWEYQPLLLEPADAPPSETDSREENFPDDVCPF